MYLHLGADSVVRESQVVGIFDLDNTSCSAITRDFLNRAEREGRAVNVSDDLPKAFVVTSEQGKDRIYLTLLASQTRARRAADGEFI